MPVRKKNVEGSEVELETKLLAVKKKQSKKESKMKTARASNAAHVVKSLKTKSGPTSTATSASPATAIPRTTSGMNNQSTQSMPDPILEELEDNSLSDDVVATAKPTEQPFPDEPPHTSKKKKLRRRKC